MAKLTKANQSARELVTETLDEVLWWSTLKVVVQFLHAKHVEQVRVEFGFVVDRDIQGKPQGQSQIVQLSDLESFIQRGLDEGTIERAGMSDFLFYPHGVEVDFMLCNDADLHFAFADSSLL